MKKLVLTLVLLLLLPPVQAETLGWLEISYIMPWNARVKTKLDTGAKTSSLHAVKIEHFDKDGEDWVYFDVPIETAAGSQVLTMERPVLRSVKVKEHKGSAMQRVVVAIDLCLNGSQYNVPVTLADRGKFNYELVLGRSMMQGHIVVDPAQTFSHSRPCADSDAG